MTETLLPGDNPQAYIPSDRRRALARGEELANLTHGAAVFVDISGFTPLTESLARELGGRRGAEELTATLDRVFAALMEPLHLWGGSVVYFSGDAVTAWIDGDDGTRATAAGLAMQAVMARVGTVTTPSGRMVTLGVKVAVAVGEVHRFVVGDPRVQLIDVLAGQLMDSLAAAEQESLPGDVVLDAGAVAALGERVVLQETRHGVAGPVGVAAALTEPPRDPGELPPWPELPEETARQWLLPPVWERMVAGRGEFLADLRPAVPVFVRFGGLDFENDPEAPEVLDRFVTGAQLAFDAQGGSVLQLTIGDKGAYLYAVFGAPVAHEDDATRACETALRLLEVASDVPVTDVQVGVATGRLRSGTYGHAERRTFCCLGDAVNLAARLMTRAPAGGIWVHGEVAAAADAHFEWDELPAITVKGRTQPVPVRKLRGRAARRRAGGTSTSLGSMVGRDAELERLRSLWRAASDGRGQVVVVQAEAGAGKSRLVGELASAVDASGADVARGEASPLSQATYAGWRDVWADLLGLDLHHATADQVIAAVERLDPRLVGRAPLLTPVLGVPLPDSGLTAAFDGELRKTSLEDLLARLLTARSTSSGGGPLAILLEDGHWLDALSRDLLEVLARTTAGLPVLLVVTSRPDGTALAGLSVRPGEHVTDLPLTPLGPDASAVLGDGRHRGLAGRPPAPELVSTVVERAEGNPFYLEQLVDYVLAHAAREDGSVDPDALELPPSLHSLVLSRIDAQPEPERRAVKVASVIGRDFQSPVVAAAYPDLGEEEDVDAHLVRLADTRLIALEDSTSRGFAFGHAVTRDVAYDSLPFSVRTVLHGRVGDVLEREPDGPRRNLDLLAHHYSRSDDLAKTRHYLTAAATAARAAYANDVAIGYLEQVLPLVEPQDRHGVLLQLAESLEVRGDWAAAEDAVTRARESAELVADPSGVARARTARAELVRKQGRYAEAEDELLAAEGAFAATGDDAGRARVLHLRGTLESQQGRPDRARAAYEASLALRERLGDEAGVAALLTNLALVAEDEDDLEEAERLGEEGLARRRALDDRRAVSVSLTNMGMLATIRGDLPLALTRFAEAQALAEEVGDPWVVAVGHHNLGNATRDLGDLAAATGHYSSALAAYAERDDLWSLAHLFEDVALWLLAAADGRDRDAAALLGAAEQLRVEIGAPRFPPTEAVLAAALGLAADRASAQDLQRAAALGRTETLPVTVVRTGDLLGT